MESFSLVYQLYNENYFAPEIEYDYGLSDGIFEGRKLNRWTEHDEYLALFEDLRKTIKRDMETVLETRIRYLNNNAGLVQELNTVIQTIDNGIDFDFVSGDNFAFRTDNYLCFNNFENYVDELELGSLGEDASTCETIVIMDCHLKRFYFIRTTKKMLSASQSTTINAYYIKDRNVKKRKVNIKCDLPMREYTDEGIQKMLSLLK